MMKKNVITSCLFLAFCCWLNAQNINHQNMAGPMGLNVNSFNGNLYFQRNDLFINARKLPIDLTFSYNSNAYSINLGFGKGWSMAYLMRWKDLPNNSIQVTRGDGFQMKFDPIYPSGYLAQPGVFDNLVQYETGKFKLISKDKTTYFFDNPTHRRLTRIQEINGNFLDFSYTDTLLTRISDAASRSIQLTYKNGLLQEVVDALDNPVRTIKYSYDASGALTKVQDPLNYTFQYSYLISGPMNKFVDKNGNAADILYNAGYQVKELITCTRDIRYSYSKTNGTSIMLEQVSGQNQVTKYKYDSKGQITQKTGNCCGFNTSFEYDDNGDITKFTDANGHASMYTYDGMGNMLSKTDALGNKLYITYNGMGRVTSFTDKNGNTTKFDLDNVTGNVLKASYPENIINEFTYNGKGDLSSLKDGNGNTTSYKYDGYGNVIEIDKPLNVVNKAAYDARSRILNTTDPNNNTTGFTNDLLNRVTIVIDATGNPITLFYDANNNITTYTDRNNHQTKMMYDAADRLLAVTNPLGNSSYRRYDEHNNLILYTDERGNSTKMAYDDLDRLTQIINAVNENTMYSYFPNGKLSNIIYPNGNNLQFTCDAMDRVTVISDDIGKIEQRQYDSRGNLSVFIDAVGNATSYLYDGQNRLVKKTDPLGLSELFTYDKNFNKLSFTDKNEHTKYIAYDELNRVSSYTDALGALTSYQYDPAGNISGITDAKGNITHYTYNNLNRQISTIYAIGPDNSSTYDANGNITAYKDGNGATTHYVYDAADQMQKIDFPGADDYTYTYDAAGNLVAALNADATVTSSYDAVNRVTTETLNNSITSYNYDIPKGSLTLKYPSGRQIVKHYDARNRIASITEGHQQLFSALYDGANKVVTQTHGNNETINYNYDAGSRLLSQTSNSIPALGFVYTYDNNGNKTSEYKTHKPDHSEQYVYDNEDQLTEFKYGILGTPDPARSQKFAYDKLKNRTMAIVDGNNLAYVSNKLNQYTSINDIAQTFDNNGNLLSDGTSVYNYNTLNQLTSVNDNILKYDAFNRLIKVMTQVDSTVYNYSFYNPLETKKGINNTSNIFGDRLDDLISLRHNGESYFVMHNKVNSVTNIMDSLAHLVEFYEYAPFGKSTIFNNNYSIVSNSVISNQLQFNGRNKIEFTELYNFRFRHYNSLRGGFIQRDPLGYIDGMNQFVFAGNNLINFNDPFGLSCTNPVENNKNEDRLNQKQLFERASLVSHALDYALPIGMYAARGVKGLGPARFLLGLAESPLGYASLPFQLYDAYKNTTDLLNNNLGASGWLLKTYGPIGIALIPEFSTSAAAAAPEVILASLGLDAAINIYDELNPYPHDCHWLESFGHYIGSQAWEAHNYFENTQFLPNIYINDSDNRSGRY